MLRLLDSNLVSDENHSWWFWTMGDVEKWDVRSKPSGDSTRHFTAAAVISGKENESKNVINNWETFASPFFPFSRSLVAWRSAAKLYAPTLVDGLFVFHLDTPKKINFFQSNFFSFLFLSSNFVFTWNKFFSSLPPSSLDQRLLQRLRRQLTHWVFTFITRRVRLVLLSIRLFFISHAANVFQASEPRDNFFIDWFLIFVF